MKTFLIPLVAATALLAGCGDDSAKETAAATNETAAPGGYLGAIVQAKNHSEKVIDVAYINQDIQLFNASEGRYPKDLQELIPNYLAKMPAVPNGYKIVYDTNNYSVKVVKE